MIKSTYIRDFIFLLIGIYYAQGTLYAQGTNFSKVIYIIIISISFFYFIKTLLLKDIKTLFYNVWTILLLLNIFGFIFTGNNSNPYHISMIKGVLLTLMIFYPFYFFSNQNIIKTKNLTSFLLLMIPLFILQYYLNSEKILNERVSNKLDVVNNISYLFVGLIPYVFLLKQKKIVAPIIMLILIFFIIESSKRGALFSGVIGLLFFIYFQIRTIEKKNRFKGYLYLTTAIIGISYFTFNLFKNNEYLTLRLENILEGESSGRNTIYFNLLYYWVQSDNFINLIFGYGFAASIQLSKTGNFAHNDWLELLTNFGIFGVTIYCILFITSLKKVMSPNWRIEKRLILLVIVLILLMNTLVYRFYSAGDGFLYSIMLAYLIGSKNKELI
jgi:hypothetical protein